MRLYFVYNLILATKGHGWTAVGLKPHAKFGKGDFLTAQWLGLHTCIAEGVGAIPSQETNSLQGLQHVQKVIYINA